MRFLYLLVLGVCTLGVSTGALTSSPVSQPTTLRYPPLRLRGGEKSQVVSQVEECFKKSFGAEPDHVIVAPGRVNLIGEHTDYNDGFVMPCAIDFHVAAAISAAEGKTLTVAAQNFDGEQSKIELGGELKKVSDKTWSNYIRGVCKILQEDKGYELKGANMVLGGNVPQGGGLSSSAAFEVATATALNHVCKLGLRPKDLALVGQSAEHWVGCNCGIMDQYISAQGKEGHALMIDCRDLSTRDVSIPKGAAVVIVNSRVKHQLAGLDSEYNTRRSQCEEAARHFGVTALRDVTSETLKAHADELDPETLKRARHVVTENERVLEAVEALQKGDLKRMGELMAASHVSMKDDFEISIPEIDALVEIMSAVLKGEGGVRLTGAGFGGSVVCLCPEAKVEELRAAVAAEYPKKSGGTEASFYVCHASQGARVL